MKDFIDGGLQPDQHDPLGDDVIDFELRNLTIGNGLVTAIDREMHFTTGGSGSNGDIYFNGKTMQELFEEYLHPGNDGPDSKTYDQKLDDVNYSMREVESLFNALSLGISDDAERKVFDTIFNNWKNDKFASRYKGKK